MAQKSQSQKSRLVEHKRWQWDNFDKLSTQFSDQKLKFDHGVFLFQFTQKIISK